MASDPLPLSLVGDPTANWKAWRQQFQNYLKGQENESEEIKCAKLLYLIGDDGREIYKTFTFKKNTNKTIQSLLDKFENHFTPQKSKLLLERVKFLSIRQEKGQSSETFANELKKQANKCDLGALNEDLTKAMFIAGIRDPILKQQMLQNDDLSLDGAVSLSSLAEMIKSTISVSLKAEQPVKQEKQQQQQQQQQQPQQQKNNCGFCGSKHERGKCFAFGKQCKVCKGMNHLAKMCKNQNQGGAKKKEKTEGFVMV